MDKIINYSLEEIAKKIKACEFTSEEVVRACICQIKLTKDINALNSIDEDGAIQEAKRIDAEIKKGNKTGALLGVPVVVKDNMCTRVMKTTCSSKFLSNFTAPYEATVVSNLKKAGAIIIGKANMDEFAMGSSNENSAFGKVLNPLDKTRVPGGSSGGSAATVASNQCFGSLGTDTGGSIRQPASLCGIVGVKPTYGLVSRRGVVAFASSLDQVGTFGRTVRDAGIMLDAISSCDERDATSSLNADKVKVSGCYSDNIKGMKIGICKQIFSLGMNDDVKVCVDRAIDFYKNAGAEIVEVELPDISVALDIYYILSSAEAASNLARYDGVKYGVRATDYDGLIDLYVKSRSEGFGSEVKRRIMLGNYVLSSGYYDAYYKKGTLCQELLKREFAKAFSMCDAILSPVSPTVAFKFGEKATPLQMYLADIYTVPVNIFGGCAISFPCGKGEGNMPVGLQLIGNHFEECKIFKLADYFEKHNGGKN
ncbi:MAG: Asp-tRNA(Asn)/Glu-tRNA(Gln) amidotransferase subunit GatA [Clostridia bacterium]